MLFLPLFYKSCRRLLEEVLSWVTAADCTRPLSVAIDKTSEKRVLDPSTQVSDTVI